MNDPILLVNGAPRGDREKLLSIIQHAVVLAGEIACFGVACNLAAIASDLQEELTEDFRLKEAQEGTYGRDVTTDKGEQP